MAIFLTIIRILAAVISPLAVILLAILTLVQFRGTVGTSTENSETCLSCAKSLPGGEGQFHYTEPIGNARERAAKQQFSTGQTPILGSETHFICDRCARRYFRNQTIQHLAMVLSYPLLLYGIFPLLAPNSYFSNFLFETLLVVLSISGLVAALDLYRATRHGNTPLDEVRDRVAISKRRKMLGRKLSYYTRMGIKKIGS